MPFSGTVAIRAMKDGDYQATIFAGTTVGLQAAIDYINAGTLGGEIRIGPGTILIDTAIELCSDLTITGSGMGATILKHSGTTLHKILSAHSFGQILLRDFTIDGDQAGVSSYAADRWSRQEAIYLDTCTDVTVSRIEITQSRGQCIHGASCSRVAVEDCWIHDADNWGSIFSVATDVDYVGNHVENVYTHGLYVDPFTDSGGSNRIRFIGNTVIGVLNDSTHADSGVGISVHNAGATAGTYDVECIGNICKDSESMGFSMTPSRRSLGHVGKMTIIGNISEGHTDTVKGLGAGFEIIGTNVLIAGNIAKNNAYHFTFQNSQGISCVGNRTISDIGDTTQYAFLFSPGAADAHVVDFLMDGNVITGGNSGFQIDTTVVTTPHTNITISNNQFLDVEFAVLMQKDGLNTSVTGNLINATSASLATGRGIQVSGDNILVANNVIRCISATGDAIVVNSGQTTDQLTLTGNNIISCRYGLNAGGTVTTLIANGNMISGAGTADTNNKSNVTNWRDGGTNSWNFKTAAPASEYWHVGTKVYDTAVAAAGNIGFVCTTAGTPGTWKTWGVVAA